MGHSRWDQPGVPHKGWSFVDMEDAHTASSTCEMCSNERVRYVHLMSHPQYQSLRVGRVCAEKMQDDYVAPLRREQEFKRRLKARKGSLERAQHFAQLATNHWWVDQKLKWYGVVRGKGYFITIFQRANHWNFRVGRRNKEGQFGAESYDRAHSAFIAALKFVAAQADPEMSVHIEHWGP
jgi:hypothetical protein